MSPLRRILLCLTVFAGLAWPASAGAAEKAIWGPTHLPGGTSAFPMYDALGVDTYQLSLLWSDVASSRPAEPRNPNDPAYRWPARFDFAVAEAQRHGIALAPVVMRTPAWANGGRDPRWTPNDPQDYADFLTAATKRYPNIRRWQIWGEPSLGSNYQPGGYRASARAYAKLLDRAYVALKQRSSKNKVIGGMTFSQEPVRFLQELRLRDGQGPRPRLDWWGHNPFSARYPDGRSKTLSKYGRDINDLDVFAGELKRAYAPRGINPKLWISEYTVQSEHGSYAFNWYVSLADQAKWVTQAYRLANRQSSVAGMGWLSLFDEPRRADRQEMRIGLRTFGGARKPAYAAYARVPSAR